MGRSRYCNNGGDDMRPPSNPGTSFCYACESITSGWCDPFTCPIDSDEGLDGSLSNTCPKCCNDDALARQCPENQYRLRKERCENEWAIWAGSLLTAGGMGMLGFVQALVMVPPLAYFYRQYKADKFKKPDDATEWPGVCCCTGQEYLQGILRSHIVCLVLGGCIP
jgi:hypothetical protein